MFPVSIKGVVFTPNDEVVLMLNERNEWELPGGRIELGETPAQCLAREIAEELDVEVSVGALIDTYLFEVIPSKHVFVCTYRCRPICPKAIEHRC
jgi:mutator protein MutT